MRSVWADYREAPVREPVKAMLAFIEELTLRPAELSAEHLEPLRAAGLETSAIEDAIEICGAFNIIARIADALDFEVPPWERQLQMARVLLKRGYR